MAASRGRVGHCEQLIRTLLLHERLYGNCVKCGVYYDAITILICLLIQSSSHPIHILVRIDPQLGQIHVSLPSHRS